MMDTEFVHFPQDLKQWFQVKSTLLTIARESHMLGSSLLVLKLHEIYNLIHDCKDQRSKKR